MGTNFFVMGFLNARFFQKAQQQSSLRTRPWQHSGMKGPLTAHAAFLTYPNRYSPTIRVLAVGYK